MKIPLLLQGIFLFNDKERCRRKLFPLLASEPFFGYKSSSVHLKDLKYPCLLFLLFNKFRIIKYKVFFKIFR